MSITILIETYWNVNCATKYNEETDEADINRDILECKLIVCSLCFTVSLILIETYWNVNLSGTAKNTSLERILIETYWNVNEQGFLKERPSLEY